MPFVVIYPTNIQMCTIMHTLKCSLDSMYVKKLYMLQMYNSTKEQRLKNMYVYMTYC